MMFRVCDVYDCEITRIFLHAPPFSVTYEKLSYFAGVAKRRERKRENHRERNGKLSRPFDALKTQGIRDIIKHVFHVCCLQQETNSATIFVSISIYSGFKPMICRK
jgi:hypothetical protein